jgi:hypothetical protein
MHINYMLYDILCSQDVVNPSTSHCNVMVLASAINDNLTSNHLFRYALVLGIYHSNVVHIGPGMYDY